MANNVEMVSSNIMDEERKLKNKTVPIILKRTNDENIDNNAELISRNVSFILNKMFF